MTQPDVSNALCANPSCPCFQVAVHDPRWCPQGHRARKPWPSFLSDILGYIRLGPNRSFPSGCGQVEDKDVGCACYDECVALGRQTVGKGMTSSGSEEAIAKRCADFCKQGRESYNPDSPTPGDDPCEARDCYPPFEEC